MMCCSLLNIIFLSLAKTIKISFLFAFSRVKVNEKEKPKEIKITKKIWERERECGGRGILMANSWKWQKTFFPSPASFSEIKMALKGNFLWAYNNKKQKNRRKALVQRDLLYFYANFFLTKIILWPSYFLSLSLGQ